VAASPDIFPLKTTSPKKGTIKVSPKEHELTYQITKKGNRKNVTQTIKNYTKVTTKSSPKRELKKRELIKVYQLHM
jgi:hypothetical protein